MKTAIYIEQGVTQLVLTPENDWERGIIESIDQGRQEIVVNRGSFYECRGGWTREGGSPESLILRIALKATQESGIRTVPPTPL